MTDPRTAASAEGLLVLAHLPQTIHPWPWGFRRSSRHRDLAMTKRELMRVGNRLVAQGLARYEVAPTSITLVAVADDKPATAPADAAATA